MTYVSGTIQLPVVTELNLEVWKINLIPYYAFLTVNGQTSRFIDIGPGFYAQDPVSTSIMIYARYAK